VKGFSKKYLCVCEQHPQFLKVLRKNTSSQRASKRQFFFEP